MPDGDRFEWRLRGKKWRTVYRLMTSGADYLLTADEAVKGVAAYLRERPEVPCQKMIKAVHESLRSPQLPSLPPESVLSGATGLMAQLDAIARASQYSEASQLAQRAASRAFLRLDGERSRVTLERLAEEFAGELSWEITERRCVGVMRDQIMEKTHRGLPEQDASELSLQAEVRRVGKRLGKQLAGDHATSELRAPKRARRAKEFTAEDLHKPLAITDLP